MANIQARRNKAGEIVSYSIRVHKGRDPVTGKERISDCVADVILKPAKAKLKVVGD